MSWKQFEIASAGSASPTGGITAVSRIPNSLEIWWIGNDGSIQDAYWYEGQDGWRQFQIAPAGSASTNGSITAVSRIPGSMEVWWIGANGSVQDAYWNADSANPAITLRAIADQGRFIEVTGIGFTPNQTVKLDYLFKLQSDVNTSSPGTETLTSDGTGSFIFRIRVTLVDISSAEVTATDVASGATDTKLLEGM